MPLLGTLTAIYNGIVTATEAKATYEEIRHWIAKDRSLESVLADLVEEVFRDQVPRLAHFCNDGSPNFYKQAFLDGIQKADLRATKPAELKSAILPLVSANITLPGATCHESEYASVIDMIVETTLENLWRKVAASAEVSRKILLDQSTQATLQDDTVIQNLKTIETKLDGFIDFARSAWPHQFDPRLDKSPPREHRVGTRQIQNPFYLARAEDFNHNFEKLARLFQSSPDWDAIQSRTQNVVLEGGRGTGKSMLLRRLTAQACLAAKRLTLAKATFDEVDQDYFGVYVKFTRGYYNQFETVDRLPRTAADLLAQHELNIEIFDAFVATLAWLEQAHAMPNIGAAMPDLVRDLKGLFPKSPTCGSLVELSRTVVAFEQDEINNFVRDQALDRPTSYNGSARETVGFLRRLSQVFRQHLFPEREIRLFLLIDEFETLLSIQQQAINSVIKMRLPDVTIKIGVRTSGYRTTDTFTPGDPIQDPRDYTPVALDYDVNNPAYSDLLRGIAKKRLMDAGFATISVDTLLPQFALTEEIGHEELDQELVRIWKSGRREKQTMNDEFRTKYSLTAAYRILNQKGKRKAHCGVDHYVLLSSGVVSTFIELCKYAFYYSLDDGIDLLQQQTIPHHIQTRAAYEVSQRLFQTIDGNVPKVGGVLKRLIADVGEIVRQRLLNHPSDTEAIRIGITDYNRLADKGDTLLAAVLDAAETWSVLQFKDESQSYRSRNRQRPPKIEFIINRIYCPALEVSPRARMRTDFSLESLDKLIDPKTRNDTYRQLMKTLGYATDKGPWLPGLEGNKTDGTSNDLRD